MIDPKSTAGVLLREHDTPKQAFDYATRMATRLLAMNNAAGLDYGHAADQIGDMLHDARPCTCHPNDNPPVPCQRKYALGECMDAAGRPELFPSYEFKQNRR